MSQTPPTLLSQVVFYLVLFVVLMSLVGGGFLVYFKNVSDAKNCLTSIIVRDKTNTGSFDCSRKVIDINVKNERYRSELAKRYDEKELDKAVTMNYIADSMVDCWKEMGEGEYNVFKNEFILDKQVHCFVCNTFKTPDLSIEQGDSEQILNDPKVLLDRNLLNFKEFLHTDLGTSEKPKIYYDLLKKGLLSNTKDYNLFMSSVTRTNEFEWTPGIFSVLPTLKLTESLYQEPTDLKPNTLYATVFWGISQGAIKKGITGEALSSVIDVQKDPGYVFVAEYSKLGALKSGNNQFNCEVMYG